MAAWGFWEWVAYGGIVVAALLIAVDGAIAQSEHLRTHFPRLLKGYMAFLPLASIVVSGCVFGYQQLHPASILDLPPNAREGSPFALVQAWGLDNNVFYMVIKTNSLLSDRKLRKLVLIVRVPFSDIDQMTDMAIKKSQAYTIIDGFMTLAVPVNNGAPWRVLANGPTPIQFILAEIPFLFSSDQIRSLSDVETLGGKILATTATEAPLVPGPATSPSNVCPPTPTPLGTLGKR